MATQHGRIMPTIFREPEFEKSEEILVAIYIMSSFDMAGVCEIYPPIVAAACRISEKKLDSILNRFEKIGKLVRSADKSHVWYKSGIYHQLYRGKCSPTQKKAAENMVNQWEFSGIFPGFSSMVKALYAQKYAMDLEVVEPQDQSTNRIPYLYPTPTLSVQSESESESKTESEAESHDETPPEESSNDGEEKPKLSNVERFDKYVADHQQDIYQICVKGEYDEKWFRAEFPNMRTWIMGNDRKGNKKDWKAFIATWMISGRKRAKKEKEDRSPVMTYAEEQAHYASKRRAGPTGDFTGVGAIANQIPGGEK